MIKYNFCAGPAKLPDDVLKIAQAELLDWSNTGCSVMEMSHRSKEFINVYNEAVEGLTRLLNIPEDYSVLFMHGGGRGQFSAVPLNLLKQGSSDGAHYVTTGSWSADAVKEAEKFGQIKETKPVINNNNLYSVLPVEQWQLDDEVDFVHYCPNETVDGIEVFESPKKVSRNLCVVADMSSTILSRVIDVNDFDLIYAGAQKNIGPSGLTIVIIKNALLKRSQNNVPSIFNYALTAEKESMFNTPPTFAIYLANLVFKWLIAKGGVSEIEKVNIEKAALLYKAIDDSQLFYSKVAAQNRSRMNVTFFLKNTDLESKFLEQAEQAGLLALKGHRSVGGIRASIYNAMPIEGVQALVNFMNKFESENT
ncbi:3-phosphoserine/phosphohydroxythreonine transaminase [Psychrosphaera aestuarii]|uniref:3-phosphoserine/phosphohydroxythreonine transaminase n=1 Tax=Psychrosphaera aestuarii TaxID=1266052 RepID=UPI001B335EA7|nr:3-phosphoserine/phosphohydroxythreonine transaminase [Psychrosphaera aestuarii]